MWKDYIELILWKKAKKKKKNLSSFNVYIIFVLPKSNATQGPEILERLRIPFAANDKNDHVTLFTLHLPLAVNFSF